MITKALAANGAKVYITGRRLNVLEATIKSVATPELLGDLSGSIHALQMDVTSKESIKSVTEAISKQDGYVNVLVNNAGISLTKGDISKASEGVEALRDGLFNDDEKSWEESELH